MALSASKNNREGNDSNTGQQLAATTVTIEGTSISTTTDNLGHYAIEVPSSNATLLFSYVGFVIQKLMLATGQFMMCP